MRTVAPAKINWTLEVLGKREDGYHEVRSVLQTIDLCDVLHVERAESLTLEVTGLPVPEDDLTMRAAKALLGSSRGAGGAAMALEKRIPIGAGLGGGSSDAAAALRTVDILWTGSYSERKRVRVARQLGSDVSFFLRGGTTAVAGRGEQIKAVLQVPEMWLVVLVPPMRLAEKTKAMYESLEVRDFGDGSRTVALVRSLRAGRTVEEEQICNAFERVAYQMFDGLDCYRDALLRSGVRGVHLAGSGPALFALAGGEMEAREIAANVDAMAGDVFVVRTLGVWEATVDVSG